MGGSGWLVFVLTIADEDEAFDDPCAAEEVE
jgi:hypothetical protein